MARYLDRLEDGRSLHPRRSEAARSVELYHQAPECVVRVELSLPPPRSRASAIGALRKLCSRSPHSRPSTSTIVGQLGCDEPSFAASLPDSVVAPVLGAARASAHVDIPVDRYQVANGRWEGSTGRIAMRLRSLSRIITASRQSKLGPKAARLREALRSSSRQRLVLMAWRLCRWHRRR